MIELAFAGWFECRLATDPDPADEPRGVSGTTFACAGEPDLDRVIRFQPGPTNRSPGPPVGVCLTAVSRDGEALEHDLAGAAVELLGEPRFEGRNGLLGRPGMEVIHPLEIAVRGPGFGLRRRDWLDAGDGELLTVASDALGRRAGGGIERGAAVTAAIAQATGIEDFLRHRLERAEAIERALAGAGAGVEVGSGAEVGAAVRRAALGRRRTALSSVARMRVSYSIDLGERGGIGSVDGGCAAGIDTRAPWPLSFWMGAWDADALCGYVAGRLGLPER